MIGGVDSSVIAKMIAEFNPRLMFLQMSLEDFQLCGLSPNSHEDLKHMISSHMISGSIVDIVSRHAGIIGLYAESIQEYKHMLDAVSHVLLVDHMILYLALDYHG